MSKGKNFVICGDIGCYTLGCAAPLNAMDSVSAWAAASPPPWAWPRPLSRTGVTDKKVFGVMGDSTFFHSGMTGAAEIIYNKGHVIPVVLDNSHHRHDRPSGQPRQRRDAAWGDGAGGISIEDVLRPTAIKNVYHRRPAGSQGHAEGRGRRAGQPSPRHHHPPPLPAASRRSSTTSACARWIPDKCRLQDVPEGGLPGRDAMKDGKAHIDETSAWAARSARRSAPSGAIERRR
jgi:indolepyruvate ferredoxin oxidoreductase alpha subunit